MVKKLSKILYPLLVLFFVSIALTRTTYAGEFSASVNESEIGYREKLKLTLKLTDESAKQQPNLDSIKDKFEIISTSNFSSTKIINGDHSVEYKWIYVLKPLKQGQFKLGPFSLETKSGIKQTNQVEVKVLDTKVNPASKEHKNKAAAHKNIFVLTKFSKNNPYKKEPFIYYVRLYTDVNLSEIIKGKLEIDGAITEQIGDHIVIDKTYKGKNYKVMQWKFHITPLKAGQLEIPEIEVVGRIPAVGSRPIIDELFDSPLGNNFEDYNFDSLAFRKSEKFVVYSDKSTVDVQDSNDEVKPWIPAKNLQLFDEWQAGTFQAGIPFTRTISLHASGVLLSQLPDIDVKSEAGKYKIFSDPGKSSQNIDNNLITSSKETILTYIPQYSGDITIPEIKIAYWNVDKNAIDYTTLPAKQIYVAPSADDPQSTAAPAQADNKPQKVVSDKDRPAENKRPITDGDVNSNTQTMHIIIAAIAGMIATTLIGLLIFLLSRRKKNISAPIDDALNVPLTKAPQTNSNNTLNASSIKSAQNASDIQKLIQSYAHTKWHMPKNLSIYSILLQLKAKYPAFDYDKYQMVSEELNKSLYAGIAIDLDALKSLSIELIKHVDSTISKSKKAKADTTKKLPKINP